jgi:hypothetical protein
VKLILLKRKLPSITERKTPCPLPFEPQWCTCETLGSHRCHISPNTSGTNFKEKRRQMEDMITMSEARCSGELWAESWILVLEDKLHKRHSPDNWERWPSLQGI